MSEKITTKQIGELITQSEQGRITRETFQRFLENPNSVFGANTILTIDRSRPFDPAKFIGKGWSIAEQDERSLVLSEVNLRNIRLETMLKDGEGSVQGEEKLRRLKKSGHIRLDAKVFYALWENKSLIPESWKGKTIYFDGTILQNPDGNRYVLYLFWSGDEWRWYCLWLKRGWYGDNPSAVLAE